MSDAVITPFPFPSNLSFPGVSTSERIRTSLRFNNISETSSFILGMVEYSCNTVSILTDVIAVPLSELYNTRLNGFPKVTPYPGSSGPITNLP